MRSLMQLIAFAAASLWTAAHAGITSATIDRVLICESGNVVYVYPTGGVQNPLACHGSNGNYYSLSLSLPRAKDDSAGNRGRRLSAPRSSS